MKVLSYSDVITNSSSEVFVLHPKPEVNREELLSEITELLNTICELTGENPKETFYIDSSETSYIEDDWGYNVEKGDIMINSVEDNSIPGWLMDFIEDIKYMPKFEDKFSGYYAEDLGEKEMPTYKWNHEKRRYEDVIISTKIKSIQRVHLG